jgi:hypothetical protein
VGSEKAEIVLRVSYIFMQRESSENGVKQGKNGVSVFPLSDEGPYRREVTRKVRTCVWLRT